jgi:acyl carrier protein
MAEFLGASESTGNSHFASSDTLDRIQKVFVESISVSAGHEDLRYEEKLEEAASLDSIAVLEFMTAVEKEFGIAMEPAFLDFDFLRDLPALASYVEGRMRQSEPKPLPAEANHGK